MDWDDFFDKDKPITQKVIDGGVVTGFLVDESLVTKDINYESEPEDNFAYVEKHVQEEEQRCLEDAFQKIDNDLLRPDSPTTVLSEYFDLEAANIYKKYNFKHHVENNFSINSHEEEITDLIRANSVVVIQGPTGCGKTTQVPQFILDEFYKKNQYCNIAVTQPRRIAAMSVAKRVCDERKWVVGTVVGFQVGLNKDVSDDTLITYMTTGVLLQKVIKNQNLNEYTHIIIDEVHERDAEMDFLLLLVRKFLRSNSKNVKVILMSATFDVDHFSKYFTIVKGNEFVPCPVFDVTKQQPHNVNIYYLNELERLLEYGMPTFEEIRISQDMFKAAIKLCRIFDTFKPLYGSVLIFLPGIYEIEEMYELFIQDNQTTTERIKWNVVVLHSSISIEEQKKVFIDAPEGQRKIVLSTNIAESSITVPDIIYVIDFCLTKILVNDPQSNFNSLKLTWASHTNCKQRAGRVGRVSAGRVYRMVPEYIYNTKFSSELMPEMLRSPLHRLVLLAKLCNLGLEPEGVLALAINPPPLNNILKTITLLKEAGGLLTTSEGCYSKNNGDITYIGRIMAHLPLDLNVSKLIVLGYLFSTLQECIIMGAATSLQSIFYHSIKEGLKMYKYKVSWADCTNSDLIAYLNIFQVWEKYRYTKIFRSKTEENNWLRSNYLQPRIMHEWRLLVTEINSRLERLNITDPTLAQDIDMSSHERAMMLKLVICGAFFPNYFVRSSEAGQVDEYTAVRLLAGRDPYTTVYFSGKPEAQPIEPYVSAIRTLLQDCGQNIKISNDNTNKIYAQFKNDMIATSNERHNYTTPISGKIAIGVYNAVKYRQLKMSTRIACLSSEEAKHRVRHWRKEQKKIVVQNETAEILSRTMLPTMEQQYIEIKVSHINSPGNFFAYNAENVIVKNTLDQLVTNINSAQLERVTSDKIQVGRLYAARFKNIYYRAKVINIETVSEQADNVNVLVLFVDYGNIENVSGNSLKKLLPEMTEIPPLALECTLTGLQPSHDLSFHAIWSPSATKEFYHLISKQETIYGRIYSIVDNILSLELIYDRNEPSAKTINQMLIDNGFADAAIESFLSQEDHSRRVYTRENSDIITTQNPNDYNTHITLLQQQLDRENEMAAEKEQLLPYQQDISYYGRCYDESNEMEPPKPEECKFSMELTGPFSPLEMKMYGTTRCSYKSQITIDWSSVNSVLLDTNPGDKHDRLLVAAGVSQNATRDRLSLRHTSIMPNIHGFPVLMAMLFCNQLDIHTNDEGTEITSILCGLGYNPDRNKSLYPAHDLALNLDFVLTNNDLRLINETRFYMSKLVAKMSGEDVSKYFFKKDVPVEFLQWQIRKTVRALLTVKREPKQRKVLHTMFKWTDSRPEGVRELTASYENDKDDIWLVHSGVQLLSQEQLKIQHQLEMMQNIAKSKTNKGNPVNVLTCQLCNITLEDLLSIKLHIVSNVHKTNLIKFENRDELTDQTTTETETEAES